MTACRYMTHALGYALILIGCNRETIEQAPYHTPQYSIEDFLGVTSYFGASFSPDNSRLLVSSDESGIYNVYAIPIAGGEPERLTDSTTDSIFSLGYFPEDQRFLYSSDRGGNELDHIYVREVDGSVNDLTPGEGLKAAFHGWTHDDQSLVITTNERDSRYFDVYLYDRDTYERTRIYQNDEGFDFVAISPDERYLALLKTRTRQDTDIFLFDRRTTELKHITPHAGEVFYGPEAFSPDGASLFYTTDSESEFRYLARYDLVSGNSEILVQPDWDVWYATPSKQGRYLVVGINNDARTEVRIFSAADMSELDLTSFPEGDISEIRFTRDETRMSFYVSSSRRPRDLFHWNIGDGPPRQLTRSLPSKIDPKDLVVGQVARFSSYDGIEIPGILYKPHQATGASKAAALVWVHGGPGGQSRIGYNALIQYLANHGYAIFAINNRGSTGYGKTFFRMDDRKHGEADLGDCVASKQMLIDTGFVDPDRIGIIGGSYGGYMVMAALAFQPEEFALGVDIFGVTNWLRTLQSIPDWWESFREALYTEMGDPQTDEERLRRISPLFHADKITRPFLVLQGANDPRVLKVESDEIVEAARANGVEVEYLVFDDEGHGFLKKENKLNGWKAILDFLDRHLEPSPAIAEQAT